jgi:SAM-dependent methyltransferase
MGPACAMPARLSFDRVADVYDRTRAMPADAAASATAGLAAILREAAPDPRLLEVGVGTGRMAAPLAAAGVRVVGIDVAPAMLARLRAKRAAVAAVVADAAAPPFRAGSFDGALFVHVLHLVPGEAALRATIPLVRRGGVLLHGHTDYTGSPRRALFALVRDVVADLGGALPPDRWRDARATFDAAAAGAGAASEERALAAWTERSTGRRVLADVAGRVYSNTWAIPDAMMPAMLERLAPRLEALLGGLDAPIETAATFALTIARLPA